MVIQQRQTSWAIVLRDRVVSGLGCVFVDNCLPVGTVTAMKKPQLLIAVAALAVLPLSACGKAEKAEPTPAPMASAPAVVDHAHARGDGNISSIQGVTLEMQTVDGLKIGNNTITFKITRGGEALTEFVTKHEKPLHAIVVRDDLSGFQHVHPEMAADGTWSLPIAFDRGGTYRIVTDFHITEGSEDVNYVLGTDLTVTGDRGAEEAFAEPTSTVSVDGFDIAISGTLSATEHGMLMLTITKDGKAVTLENYLGSTGHLVAFRQNDLSYAHMHADGHDHSATKEAESATADTTAGADAMGSDMGTGMSSHMAGIPGMLHFETEFPQGAGSYKMFLQFQVDGKLHTATFTAVVA